MVQEIRKQVCLAEIVAVSAYVRFHPQDSRLPSSIAVLPTFDRGVCIGGPHRSSLGSARTPGTCQSWFAKPNGGSANIRCGVNQNHGETSTPGSIHCKSLQGGHLRPKSRIVPQKSPFWKVAADNRVLSNGVVAIYLG